MLALKVFSSTLHAVLGKRGTKLVLSALLIAIGLPLRSTMAEPSSVAKTEPEVLSPTGQVSVVTANARQLAILDVRHFRRMLGLTLALRNRPPAWDGGFDGAVTAPDVIVLQEMTDSNLDIINKLLKQRSDYKYEPLAAEGSSAKFLINVDTVTLQAEPETWIDPCIPGAEGKDPRRYQLAHFTEIQSGLNFTVAGVHFFKTYNGTGQDGCRERNIDALRTQLSDEIGPVIVGGDFNFRARTTPYECDPNEESEPNPWWSMMTTPADGGPAYVDAVYAANQQAGLSMADEWTHEQDAARQVCTGETTHKRGRIDYLFATGTIVADAHADNPGWAGEEPGTTNPENKKYSDHRFVWGRFVLAGPPEPAPITAVPAPGGDISLSWSVVEGASSYLLYRAVEGHEFSLLTELDGATPGYVDQSADDGTTYTYAIAALDASGLQGVEAVSERVVSDSTGPRVKKIDPAPGAEGVARNVTIEVRFDEAFNPKTVGQGTVKLLFKGQKLPGELEETSDSSVSLDPNGQLKKNKPYKIVVRAVEDALGNEGKKFSSTFTTGR